MKKELQFNIAQKLLSLREENHLTQNELSKQLEINRATYSNYEASRVEIPISTLNKIANFYHVNIDYILGLDKRQKINSQKGINFQTLADNLKQFMKENNLKIESLAIDANTTISTIWAYLHNKETIRTTYLYLICKNNNLSVDQLLERIIL